MAAHWQTDSHIIATARTGSFGNVFNSDQHDAAVSKSTDFFYGVLHRLVPFEVHYTAMKGCFEGSHGLQPWIPENAWAFKLFTRSSRCLFRRAPATMPSFHLYPQNVSQMDTRKSLGLTTRNHRSRYTVLVIFTSSNYKLRGGVELFLW